MSWPKPPIEAKRDTPSLLCTSLTREKHAETPGLVVFASRFAIGQPLVQDLPVRVGEWGIRDSPDIENLEVQSRKYRVELLSQKSLVGACQVEAGKSFHRGSLVAVETAISTAPCDAALYDAKPCPSGCMVCVD